MTLGKKLSNHRKLLGWTQQQLGEHLNLSAQAVSKWENDLAEPDLATLKALANLYSVTVDQLLSTEDDSMSYSQNAQAGGNIDADRVAETVAHALDDKMKGTPKTIGFCKNCGIAVTEENAGEDSPVVLCKNCVEQRRVRELEKAEEERKREQEKQRKEEARKATNASTIKRRRTISFIVAGIIAAAFLVLVIAVISKNFTFGSLVTGLVLTYAVFSFVCMLFYDSAVGNIVSYMCSASIKFPGLIFTFDLDGFIWLIAMKLLFAVIGFLFGLICTILGFILGIVIAPFVFPYIMIRLNREIAKGVVSKYVY